MPLTDELSIHVKLQARVSVKASDGECTIEKKQGWTGADVISSCDKRSSIKYFCSTYNQVLSSK